MGGGGLVLHLGHVESGHGEPGNRAGKRGNRAIRGEERWQTGGKGPKEATEAGKRRVNMSN